MFSIGCCLRVAESLSLGVEQTATVDVPDIDVAIFTHDDYDGLSGDSVVAADGDGDDDDGPSGDSVVAADGDGDDDDGPSGNSVVAADGDSDDDGDPLGNSVVVFK